MQHPPHILLTLFCLLAGCSQSPTSSQLAVHSDSENSKRQLLGPAITGTLAGKRFQWIRARDQATGETLFAADGGMTWRRMDVVSSGSGRWSVDGGKLCQEFDPTPQWKGGRVCRKLYTKGSTLVSSPNDGGLVTYTQVPGT